MELSREVIDEIKRAALEENYDGLLILGEHFPEEVRHAAIEHQVGKLVYQNEE